MKKILWLDTETTGMDPTLHSIIQIAGIIDVNGSIKETFDLKVRPHPDFEIDEQSIEVHGVSVKDMFEFPEISIVHGNLKRIFDNYVNKFDKSDKFIIAGQRISFDLDFLSHFWIRQGDKYLMSYINYANRIELLDITKGLKALDIIKSDNIKLESLCKEFGIEIKAHDALSDITATRELYYMFKNNLKWSM